MLFLSTLWAHTPEPLRRPTRAASRRRRDGDRNPLLGFGVPPEDASSRGGADVGERWRLEDFGIGAKTEHERAEPRFVSDVDRHDDSVVAARDRRPRSHPLEQDLATGRYGNLRAADRCAAADE